MEAANYKKKAGFSDDEVDGFRERFNHFDKDLSGSLSGGEIFKILEQCGFEPKTREEQSNIAALLEACKQRRDAHDEIDFEGFLQLVRVIEEMRVLTYLLTYFSVV